MVAYLLIICVAFFFVSTSLIGMVGEYLFAQKVQNEQQITDQLAQEVAASLFEKDAQALYDFALSKSDQYDARIMVVDAYGVVQSDAYSEYNGRRLELGEVADALSSGESTYGYYGLQNQQQDAWFGRLTSFSGESSMLGLYAAPVYSGATLLGALVYTSLSQEVYQNLSRMQRQMGVWLVLVAASVALISFFVSRFFTRPINELSQGIARMTQGDLSSRVAVHGKNEFAQLAEAFNMMCERLENLDQTRNQFVSNASHELKTPLSTMKILIETMLYQQEAFPPEMQKEFLGDVNREIDRLNAIVNDLLTLTHFDSGNVEIHPIKLRLDELLAGTVKRLEPLAEKRDIHIELKVNDSIETMADHMKLEQVFYNLADNAIKYTPPGGKVSIELTRAGRKAVIRVIDTGIGIPKADLRHVFDRFYRVDKARARETGGTGLGLSIVKQIVQLHEGTISVSSEENQGSVFTVELPIVNI